MKRNRRRSGNRQPAELGEAAEALRWLAAGIDAGQFELREVQMITEPRARVLVLTVVRPDAGGRGCKV